MFGIDSKKISKRNLERRIKRKTKKLKLRLRKMHGEIEDQLPDFSEYDLDELASYFRALLHMVTR